MNWYIKVWKNYAVFNGRATRSEFWYFFLIHVVVILILGVIDNAIWGSYSGFELFRHTDDLYSSESLYAVNTMGPIGILTTIYFIAASVPYLAVAVRRLHDTNRSGWWVLIKIIPIVGLIVIFIFMVLDGTPGDNRFGGDPKASESKNKK